MGQMLSSVPRCSPTGIRMQDCFQNKDLILHFVRKILYLLSLELDRLLTSGMMFFSRLEQFKNDDAKEIVIIEGSKHKPDGANCRVSFKVAIWVTAIHHWSVVG